MKKIPRTLHEVQQMQTVLKHVSQFWLRFSMEVFDKIYLET